MIASTQLPKFSNIVRFYYKCKGGVGPFVQRIVVWHHEACLVMPNGDQEGQIFLSHSHTNNALFFLAYL